MPRLRRTRKCPRQTAGLLCFDLGRSERRPPGSRYILVIDQCRGNDEVHGAGPARHGRRTAQVPSGSYFPRLSHIPAREVGAILGGFGIHKQRRADGWMFSLDTSLSCRLHNLALRQGVLNFAPSGKCKHCDGIKVPSSSGGNEKP